MRNVLKSKNSRGAVSRRSLLKKGLGRTIHPGQQGGLHMMRDIPRFVTLMERGLIDAKSMLAKACRIDDTRQAIQDTADRTIIVGVVQYT